MSPKYSKNQNFEKSDNLLEISSFYTCAPKITTIWCTVPEIQSETDKIFVILGHFLHFYHPNIKILKKKMKKMPGNITLLYIHDDIYIYIWFLKYKVIRCDRQKFSTFWAVFCLFSPLTTWKIKILLGIIILPICTINDNHMRYGFWDVERNKHNFLSLWTVFCPFPPLWTKKIKIF